MAKQTKRKSLRVDIITPFPEAFSYLDTSLLKRARERGLLTIKLWHLRDFATDRHKTIDDRPYGGGPGMVLKVDVLHRALETVKKAHRTRKRLIILTDLGGKVFSQGLARTLSGLDQLIIICGHYEGVDARIEKFVDAKISIGPYTLSGGELAAMVIVDAVARHLPGFLHKPESLEEVRGKGTLQSVPTYTRPPAFKLGRKTYRIPPALAAGNHKEIEAWKTKHAKRIKG